MFRRFRPSLSLSAKMKLPGGMHAGEAIRRADETLLTLQETCLTGIDDALNRMEELIAAGKTSQMDLEGMYSVASSVIDLCGGVAQGGLETAARSLCDYVDRIGEGERLDQRGVAVHVASMRLLHRTAATPAERQVVLDGLEQLSSLSGH